MLFRSAEAPRADGFEWGMTALPALEEGGDRYSYTWFEQAWIPSGAEHIDAGKQFIAFLYSDVACEIFAAAGAIQPVLGIADSLEGDNKLFYSIYDNGAKAAMGNFAALPTSPASRSAPPSSIRSTPWSRAASPSRSGSTASRRPATRCAPT